MMRFNPAPYWTNAIELGLLLAEAQAVVSMRVLGMAGVWSVAPSEDTRMVSEKTEALSQASADAAKVMMAGGTPDRVMAAALKPIRKKTRANAKRLGKRGLKRS